MSLRKNPVHPAATAVVDVDIADPIVAANGIPDQTASPPGGQPATQASPPGGQPATQASAPTPVPPAPAKPVLSSEEITALQARLARADNDSAQARIDQAIAVAKAREEARQEAETELRASMNPELEQLRRDLAARDEALEKFQREALKRDMDNLVQFDPATLQNLDPDVAKELTTSIVRPTMERLKRVVDSELQGIRKAHQAETEKLASRMDAADEARRGRARAAVNSQILAEIPNFVELKDSTAFREFMAKVPDGSRQSYGDAITEAYREGDADFVIKQVRVFQQGRPTLDDVAEVDLTRTGNVQASAPTAKPKYRYADLGEQKTAFQQGRIDRKQYQAFMSSFTEAEKEGRVS